ncbi:Sec-independent protein translocase protein TatC [Wenzhouxiangella marina]|uniref:Sec-independent protein translocase protein TatC n=1 Tax=Wenzhouxiangella marina TaxID=1579979 RepID=A0A0K0XSP8_9GAMM|nr:Sec-independent protein translocase protein TatC [Wenzhouxiangella marina]
MWSVSETSETDRELTLIEHLLELRGRVLKALLAVTVAVLVLVPFSRPLYTLFSEPLVRQLPEGSSMIAIDVTSPFFAPFKLVMLLGILLAMPAVLYQLWAFVAPGLYRHEQRLARPLLAASVLLFYAGCAFAYFVVFPVIFAFFTAMAPEGVSVMTDINRYLDFVLTLFIAFGVAFQVPVATIVLVAIGVVTPQGLARVRGYVVIGVFTVAMLVTPPDMFSQTLLALPVWLLYELGIVMSRVLVRPSAEATDSGAD